MYHLITRHVKIMLLDSSLREHHRMYLHRPIRYCNTSLGYISHHYIINPVHCWTKHQYIVHDCIQYWLISLWYWKILQWYCEFSYERWKTHDSHFLAVQKSNHNGNIFFWQGWWMCALTKTKLCWHSGSHFWLCNPLSSWLCVCVSMGLYMSEWKSYHLPKATSSSL